MNLVAHTWWSLPTPYGDAAPSAWGAISTSRSIPQPRASATYCFLAEPWTPA